MTATSRRQPAKKRTAFNPSPVSTARSGRIAKTAAAPASAKKRPSAQRKSPKSHAEPSGVPSPIPSKQARLIEALKNVNGASIAQLTKLTGWQSHTVRGSISGVLRKKLGLNVTSAASAEGGDCIYRIVESVAA